MAMRAVSRTLPSSGRSLIQRLEARLPEIERAMLDRVYGISDPAKVDDPDYVMGLRAAVSAAIGYGIDGIALRERPSMPAQLLAQARHASRSGISLDTVLRRYVAGFALFSEFLSEAAEETSWVQGPEMRDMLRTEAALLDHLLAAVGEEYGREAERHSQSAEERRVERVRRLLAGEILGPADLHYDLNLWHLAAVASGPGAVEALRAIANALDSRLLVVCPNEKLAWAWFGGSPKSLARNPLRLVASIWPSHALLGLGEPGEALAGWRLSHRQAAAAMSVAQRSTDKVASYAEVSMLASALQDDLLSSSLQRAYLAPLECAPDGGVIARNTLNAYLAANQNTSSAAAALGVSRKTVSARLRSAEEKIGRPVDRCARELETALKLRELSP